MEIDQERAEIWLAANGFADSRAHSATEIAELLSAYAAECVRAESRNLQIYGKHLISCPCYCAADDPEPEVPMSDCNCGFAAAIEREG